MEMQGTHNDAIKKIDHKRDLSINGNHQTTLHAIVNSKTEKGRCTLLSAANELIALGFKVLPAENKVPIKKVKSVIKLRSNPISDKNVGFYFDDDTPQIGILTGDQFEVVDVDCKNDLTGNLFRSLLYAIECTLPEVFKKLVIESSPSAGYHILYRCSVIGGNAMLASRSANAQELAKGERSKVLIETRGEGGYIITSPSPGYTLIQGEHGDIDFISPEDRHHILAICKSFDQSSSAELQGITTAQNKREDTPWKVFNATHDYQWMVAELIKAGWTVEDKDKQRIFVLRPGSFANRSGSIWIESNILYLFSTSTEFEAGKPYSAFGVLCQLKYNGDVRACAKDLAEQGIGSWLSDEGEFHCVTKSGKIEIRLSTIVQWLKVIGFRKYRCSDHDYDIVQIVEGKVCMSDTDRIKKIFGDYLKDAVDEKVYNYFLSRLASIFSKEGIIALLEDIDENKFIKSTDKTGWLYFNNTALHIDADQINLTDYGCITGYVWQKNINKRNFSRSEENGDVSEFIKLISGGKDEMILRFRCAFGYLLHKYKDPANPRVIILNDEFFDENNDFEPEGGTGKGLCIQLVRQLINVYSADGKRFNLRKNFPLQGITPETELMAIEDAAKDFDFEQMFSSITEGFVIEKKGRDEYIIPFERAPKILITTNYAIKGSSSSHLRRRYELEVSSYFNHRNRPIDHFKRRFFVDWNHSEWLKFDNYMVNCLQLFLKHGLPEQLTKNLERKKLIQETNRDFVKWLDDRYEIKGLPEKISKDELKAEFVQMYPDYTVLLQGKFSKWLSRWCDSKRIGLDASNKYNGVMVYAFRMPEKNEQKSYELLENGEHKKFVNEDETSLNPSGNWSEVMEEPPF